MSSNGYLGLINIDVATASGGTADSTKALQSATTTINVSAATAPTAGQVLTSTSATAANWQTPAGGSSTQGTLLNLSDTTQSTSVATGALVVDGGAGIAKDVFVGGKVSTAGIVNIDDTTQSSSSISGALIVDGGVGIAKDLYVGGTINGGIQGGALVHLGTATSDATGSAAIQLDSVFSANYENYHIEVNVANTSGGACHFRLAASGTPETGSVYNSHSVQVNSSGAVNNYFSGTASDKIFCFNPGATETASGGFIRVYKPNEAAQTSMTSDYFGTDHYITSGRITNTTAYDGIVITGTAIKGTVKAYGIADSGVAASATTLALTATTQSTATSNGALTVAGGAGIGKDLFVGGNLTVVGRNGPKNILVNGGMRIAQRSTSFAGITSGGFYALDRWKIEETNLGIWTMSQETDVPTGKGFSSSLKLLCTTGDASPAASDNFYLTQKIEGQALQYLKKGTASAESVTISFWVKSDATGTYIIELQDIDNSRHIAKSYTIDSGSTWEYKTLTFAGDTTGAFDDDAVGSLNVIWWLAGGSNVTSGTLATSWATTTAANRAVGQVNLGDANNFITFTGMQLEAGVGASGFEFERIEDDQKRCDRYYQRLGGTASMSIGTGLCNATTQCNATINYRNPMIAAPTTGYANLAIYDGAADTDVTSLGSEWLSTSSCRQQFGVASGLTQYRPCLVIVKGGTSGYLELSAEL